MLSTNVFFDQNQITCNNNFVLSHAKSEIITITGQIHDFAAVSTPGPTSAATTAPAPSTVASETTHGTKIELTVKKYDSMKR